MEMEISNGSGIFTTVMEGSFHEKFPVTTPTCNSGVTCETDCLGTVCVKPKDLDKASVAVNHETVTMVDNNHATNMTERDAIREELQFEQPDSNGTRNTEVDHSQVDVTAGNASSSESNKSGQLRLVKFSSVDLLQDQENLSEEGTVEHVKKATNKSKSLWSQQNRSPPEAVGKNSPSAPKNGLLKASPVTSKAGLKKKVCRKASIKRKTRRLTSRKCKTVGSQIKTEFGSEAGLQQQIKHKQTSQGAEATRTGAPRKARVGRPPKVKKLEGDLEDDLCVHFQNHPCSTGEVLGQASGRSDSPPRKKPKNRQQCLKCEYCGKVCTLPHNLRTHLRIHTGERPYSCDVCGKSFSTTSNLQVHKRVHTGERPYLCEQCGKSFRRVCHLQVHRKMHKGKLPFKCDHCRRSFSLQSELQQHLRFHTEDGLFKCLFCTKVYNIFSLLEKHMRTHTGEKPFQCHRCGKRFAQSSKVIEHMRIHTGERPYKCTICDKGFRASHFLINHMKSHTKEHTYLCELCGKTLHTQSGLITHKKNHAVEGSFKCQHCDKCYDHLSELNRHVKVHFEKWTYLCDLCGKSFRSLQDTQAHMKTHNVNPSDYITEPSATYSETVLASDCLGDGLIHQSGSKDRQMKIQEHIRLFIGERPFVCKECGKHFAYANVLAKHMATHNKEKLFKCRRCGKNFSRKDDLQVHKRIHSGERPYTCDQCGKSFRVSSILAKHMRIHTGERPYTCEQCGKSFTQLGGLRTHLKTHTRDQSHNCHQCGKVFKSAGTLRKHMMFHSGERPYVCEECGKGFVQMGDLNKHRRVHARAEKKQAAPKYEQSTTMEMGHLMEIYNSAGQHSAVMAHGNF